jgi:hypothetical protein
MSPFVLILASSNAFTPSLVIEMPNRATCEAALSFALRADVTFWIPSAYARRGSFCISREVVK